MVDLFTVYSFPKRNGWGNIYSETTQGINKPLVDQHEKLNCHPSSGQDSVQLRAVTMEADKHVIDLNVGYETEKL